MKKRNDAPREPFRLASLEVAPGGRGHTDLPVARFVTGEWLNLPVEIVHGAEPGPTLWMSGAIHGDELDGVEIIRRVLKRLDPDELRGTVIGVPVVNVFGFAAESRYLPDRRDLNRSFPGKDDGSMASRLAHLFMTEIVARSDFGLDFHCGSDDRINLPQVRANLEDPGTKRLARAFAPPVLIHGRAPDGSLRKTAVDRGIPTLVYEGGEAGRFTKSAIKEGVDGTLRVLADRDMIDDAPEPEHDPIEATSLGWVRAPRSGICRIDVDLGERVKRRQKLGSVTELMGRDPEPLRSSSAGIVIGKRVHPLVHQGEALIHLAK